MKAQKIEIRVPFYVTFEMDAETAKKITMDDIQDMCGNARLDENVEIQIDGVMQRKGCRMIVNVDCCGDDDFEVCDRDGAFEGIEDRRYTEEG